ncbi:MAG: alpha/beta hydrolase, partial [Syntrophales bacterium]|nr:alpha/beta hydrolase [Syntrophales bacterium]
MIDITKIDYSVLDRPALMTYLFHPRPEYGTSDSRTVAEDVLIPVEKDVVVGARFHLAEKTSANILFFHGNGEIARDYDDLGTLYRSAGINFLPVDYRGYGRSTGSPTITAMMRDSHLVFDYVYNWLTENGYTGPFIVMGRSLGSASALELMANYKDKIDGAIIESGFAYSQTLLNLLGINMKDLGLGEEDGFRNIDKIRTFDKPTLIIHAEKDHILPFADGQTLYNASPAKDKKLLEILGANHNDIFLRGMEDYMRAV